MPTTYWLKFGNTPLGYNEKALKFTHVEQPGSLTITLNGTGTGFDPDKAFTLNVSFGSAISYTVDGVPVQSSSASYTASLKNGESVVLGNIPFGTTYSVTEQELSNADVEDGYSTGAVTNGSGTMTDAGSIPATANYSYTSPAYGSIRFHVQDGTSAVAASITITLSRAVRYAIDGVRIAEPNDTISISEIQPGNGVDITMLPAGLTFGATGSHRKGSAKWTFKNAAGAVATYTHSWGKDGTTRYSFANGYVYADYQARISVLSLDI